MAERDIMTIRDLRNTIKTCDLILVQLCFGVSEREVKLSKKEAQDFIDGMNDDITPAQMEMYCGRFGTIGDDNILHMG